MAADSNSALLGLLMQGTGNNSNSWGDNLNNFVFAYLEQAIAGYVGKTLAGGAATLTAAQHRAGMIEFTGTLSSNATVTVDNSSKRWRFFNNTTGNYVVLVKTAAGNPIEIPQGTHKDVVCDGNDNLYRLDADKVGNLIHHAGSTAPPGTMACSGGTYVRADHPDLFSRIGTTWGAGNGVTTAGLPNFTDTNRFLRAAGGSLAVGSYQASQNKAHTHTASGTTTVTGTTDSQGAHQHDVFLKDPGHKHKANQPTQTRNDGTSVASFFAFSTSQDTTTDFTGITIGSVNGTANDNRTASAGSHSHTVTASGTTTVTVASDGGTEARPESAAVLICVVI
jgi:microcystin-dependent protein